MGLGETLARRSLSHSARFHWGSIATLRPDLTMHGQFVWYELTTPDVDAARKFYSPITGWGTQRFDQDYTMWTSGGVPIGGVFRLGEEQRQQGIPPNWMPYVESHDVDETARLAASLGGMVVHGPADVPGTGRFAVLQDPQGATFGVYRANGASQSWDGTPTVGRMSWHELMTTDWRKAFDFYRRLFGWEDMQQMDMGGGNMYTIFGKEKMFGGMFTATGDMAGMHPFWLCYVHVKNVDAAVATAIRGGGRLHRGPMEIPGGVIAILGDPEGAGFAVHHVSAAVAAPGAAPKAKTAAVAKKKSPVKKRVVAKKKSPVKKRVVAKKKPAARKKSAPRMTSAPKAKRSSSAGARRKSASRTKAAAKKAGRKRAAKRARSRA
jgi:predicted enzyme related to lactoylglutathione lyase